MFHIDGAFSEMLTKYLSEQTGVGSRLFISKSEEHKAASDLSCGELILGQFECFHLRPVMWYILQILGIYANLAQQLPVPFYFSEVSFSFVLFDMFSGQAVFVEDPSYGLVTTGKIVLAFKPSAALEGELLSQGNDFHLQ